MCVSVKLNFVRAINNKNFYSSTLVVDRKLLVAEHWFESGVTQHSKFLSFEFMLLFKKYVYCEFIAQTNNNLKKGISFVSSTKVFKHNFFVG